MTAKEILRVNHIPSPFFKTEPLTRGSKTDNAKIDFFAGIGYNFMSTDKANAQINLLLPFIEAGDWVFSCDLAAGTSSNYAVHLVADDFSKEYGKSEGVGDSSYHAVTLRFKYDAVKRAMLQIRTTSFVNLRNGLQLELASTYDAAVSGGGSGSSPGTPCPGSEPRRAGGAR